MSIEQDVKDVIYSDSDIIEVNGRHRIVCRKFKEWGTVVIELVTSVGRGSAGTVWAARRIEPSYEIKGVPFEFAVKIIDLGHARMHLQYDRGKYKARREVSIMSTLKHSGIVTLYGAIEAKSSLHLIMDYVKGGELFTAVINNGHISYDQIRFLLYQLVITLQYVHKQGIIHRDLKLENILIDHSVAPGYYIVKIADFGLSKFVGLDMLATSFVGTPQYWAPEVILNNVNPGVSTYGESADIWSLGCLMYVLVAMQYPFEGNPEGDNSDNARQRNILSGKVVFNNRFDNQAYRDLIKKILVVDVSKRATMEDILAHPFMNEPRPNDAPPYHIPEETINRAPLIVTAGSVLQSLSAEPVYRHNKATAGNNKVKPENELHPPPDTATPVKPHANDLGDIFAGLKNQIDLYRREEPVSNIGIFARQLEQNLDKGLDFYENAPMKPIEESTTERLAGEIFDAAELAELQLSIMRHLQWTYLAYRNDPTVVPRIGHSMRQYKELTLKSGSVISLFHETCNAVLDMLPDLKMAVTENLPDLAIGLFEEILNVSKKLLYDAENIKLYYQELISYLDETLHMAQQLKLQQDCEIVAMKHNRSPSCKALCPFEPDKTKDVDLKDDHFVSPMESTGLDSADNTRMPTPSPTYTEEREKLFDAVEHFAVDSAAEQGPDITSELFDKLLFITPDQKNPNKQDGQNYSDTEGSQGRCSNLSDMGGNDMQEMLIRRSKMLRSALNEMRRVESILGAITHFWENIKLTIEKMLTMRTHAERLLSYSNRSSVFANRFHERLDTYVSFWESLRTLCKQYLVSIQRISPAIGLMIHEVENFRDSLDTMTSMFAYESDK